MIYMALARLALALKKKTSGTRRKHLLFCEDSLSVSIIDANGSRTIEIPEGIAFASQQAIL